MWWNTCTNAHVNRTCVSCWASGVYSKRKKYLYACALAFVCACAFVHVSPSIFSLRENVCSTMSLLRAKIKTSTAEYLTEIEWARHIYTRSFAQLVGMEWNRTVDRKWERVGLYSCESNSCGHVCERVFVYAHTECEWVTLIATKAAAATNINCPYTCSYLRLIRLWNEWKKTRAHTNARTRANIQHSSTHGHIQWQRFFRVSSTHAHSHTYKSVHIDSSLFVLCPARGLSLSKRDIVSKRKSV